MIGSLGASYTGGGVHVVAVGVKEKVVDVFEEEVGVGRQGVDIPKSPREVWSDVVDALKYLWEVGLDAGEMAAVVEDVFEDGNDVVFELVETGEYVE